LLRTEFFSTVYHHNFWIANLSFYVA
jgi:hypothetical protein